MQLQGLEMANNVSPSLLFQEECARQLHIHILFVCIASNTMLINCINQVVRCHIIFHSEELHKQLKPQNPGSTLIHHPPPPPPPRGLPQPAMEHPSNWHPNDQHNENPIRNFIDGKAFLLSQTNGDQRRPTACSWSQSKLGPGFAFSWSMPLNPRILKPR